jgi:tetratricopeptide (TPR) repeat protein
VLLPLVLALTVVPALAGPAEDARKAADERRWFDAAEAWTKILKGNREAALGLTTAVIEGNLTEMFLPAEDALQTLLAKRKNDREVRLALGNLFIAQARSKTDQQAMKFIFEDAKEQFRILREADPKDEEAVVGLARTHYWMAFFDDALTALEDFLNRDESRGPALYWKGQICYVQALDAYRQAGAIDETAKELFQKAKDAYQAAVAVQPELFDAWLQLAYSAQYLGGDDNLAVALGAYESALALDNESFMPLKGIEALYFHKPDEYLPHLASLAKKHPANCAVYFYMGFRQLHNKDHDAAVKSFTTYVNKSRTPEKAWTFLGQAFDGRGDEDEAMNAYVKALELNPDDAVAAGALDVRLFNEHLARAKASVANAMEALKAYADLLRMAPRNPKVRNNLAFLLRDAIDANGKAASWNKVLDECIRLYVEASELVEQQVAGREETFPAVTLYDLAGVVNDTGLMFQYYAARRDLEKAEEYYLRSLELTGDAYADAFGNLVQVYLEQERWQEAYDLARDCADVVTTKEGAPHPNRAVARQIMDRLVSEGKVTED